MKKYRESDNSVTLLIDYMSFMSKYEEYDNKMDALEADLNDAEEQYYLEVILRCERKMLEAI